MPRLGKCPNFSGCLLAYRNETISIGDDAPFLCPECKKHLMDASATPPRPMAIQRIILGGISLLVIMGAGAVYYQVLHLKQNSGNKNQIGSSFEQAQVAVEHGELMPSRHMAALSPTPAGSASPSPGGIVPPNNLH
jgi:hypothetical protein